ncbi:alpha/beta hydrolase [filamentous cyanobacterium CCP5]|nr:alpha/beta hydrolase [filamentous cyanobacterium CCP5]
MAAEIANSGAQPLSPQIGGRVETFVWRWQDHPLTITYEILGEGDPVLLLAAFSTVSTRGELKTLAASLGPGLQAIALDWPGFGQSDRPRLPYGPELYRQFLGDFVQQVTGDQPLAIAAAGHGAGYALHLAADHPALCRRLVLIAPTWRGPLAVMGVPSALRAGVQELVRAPVIGQVLYGLNTQPSFLKWMYERHVFVDSRHLTPEYIEQRHQSTQRAGGRYGPAAFVTGNLDPFDSRLACLECFERLTCPVMVLVAERAPSASKAEMEAIAAIPNVEAIGLPGSLGLAEEYGQAVAEVMLPFLLSGKQDGFAPE